MSAGLRPGIPSGRVHLSDHSDSDTGTGTIEIDFDFDFVLVLAQNRNTFMSATVP